MSELQVFLDSAITTAREEWDCYAKAHPLEARLIEADLKVWKRCAIEGCRFGVAPCDTPKDRCIYCGQPRERGRNALALAPER